jgi:hypothetical protein
MAEQQTQQRHPSLISKKSMEAMTRTSGSSRALAHEIFLKVNNAKDKTKKIAVLKENDTPGLRQLCKAAFDPNIKFDLPEGTPPYIENEAPAGTQHTSLFDEASKLYVFIVGGNNQINRVRKETLFIQTLENLHKDDAKALISIKNKSLNKAYKGLTESVVKEAFNWNDNFTRK